MKATTALGKIGNFPIRGAVVNIESADIAPLVNATTTAVKILTAAGLTTAGIALLAAMANAERIRVDTLIPLSALARISENYNDRMFFGICLDDEFNFSYGTQNLSVSLDVIKMMRTSYDFYGGYDLYLVDGSQYQGVDPITQQLTFLSLAGRQTIRLTKKSVYAWVTETKGLLFRQEVKRWKLVQSNGAPLNLTIEGVSPTDVQGLKNRLKYAIANTRESVIAAIGEDVFSHFFK